MRFLHGYLLWAVAKKMMRKTKNRTRIEALANSLGRFDALNPFDDVALQADESDRRDQLEEPIVSRTLLSLIDASNRNPRPVSNDLFHGGDSEAEKEHSYFVIYRFSTNRGAIVKSFLVCQKPERNVTTSYGFNHFIWGGRKPEFRQHIYRECEGLILRFERAYYFLGYNYLVPVDKRKSPEKYGALRSRSKEHPNGMGMIAAEYDDINLHPGLFGGVTMTLAAASQPIVGRVAFLHVGTATGLGIEVNDSDVEPTELFESDLAADLEKMVRRLRRKGAKQFGLELQQTIDRGAWSSKGKSELARRIVGMIDNAPAWERQRGMESNSRSKPAAKGALETTGHLRD